MLRASRTIFSHNGAILNVSSGKIREPGRELRGTQGHNTWMGHKGVGMCIDVSAAPAQTHERLMIAPKRHVLLDFSLTTSESSKRPMTPETPSGGGAEDREYFSRW